MISKKSSRRRSIDLWSKKRKKWILWNSTDITGTAAPPVCLILALIVVLVTLMQFHMIYTLTMRPKDHRISNTAEVSTKSVSNSDQLLEIGTSNYDKNLRSHNDEDNVNNLHLPRSKSPIISAGEGSSFPQVFYRGNINACEITSSNPFFLHPTSSDQDMAVIPMFPDGYAAGPKIDCTPTMVIHGECDPEQKLWELEVFQAFRQNKAFQVFLPHQSSDGHNAIVVTRPRRSSSTGVAFLDERHFVVASYGMRKLYLYEYTFTDTQQHARLIYSVDTTGNPDLLDVDHSKQMISISQLFRGSQALFKYDLEEKIIVPYKEVYAFGKDSNQWCHEATIYPSSATSVVVAASSNHWYPHSLSITFFDYEANQKLAEFFMSSHDKTKGFKAQAIRFINDKYFIINMTQLKVRAFNGEKCCSQIDPPQHTSESHGRIALFKLNFSVEDIVSGKEAPASSSAFEIIDMYDVGVSALDGLSHHNHKLMSADQLNDRVLVFHIDIDSANPITFVGEQRGYLMPHGVALSKFSNLFAVASYGDNSVILQQNTF